MSQVASHLFRSEIVNENKKHLNSRYVAAVSIVYFSVCQYMLLIVTAVFFSLLKAAGPRGGESKHLQ